MITGIFPMSFNKALVNTSCPIILMKATQCYVFYYIAIVMQEGTHNFALTQLTFLFKITYKRIISCHGLAFGIKLFVTALQKNAIMDNIFKV